MTGAGEGIGGGEELTEKKSKQNRPPPKLQPIEMLSEFRGEHGSIGQDHLNRGEYHEAINFFDKAFASASTASFAFCQSAIVASCLYIKAW